MKNLFLRIEVAFHLVDAYLFALQGKEAEYADACDRASQAKFKLTWG